MSSPGDWLAVWQGRLPLRALWVGQPKGRSVKALRDRVDTLCANKDTRSQGILLGEFAKRVGIAAKWRGGAIVMSLSDAELESDLNALGDVVYTADIGQALVARATQRAIAEKQYDQLVDLSVPFHSGEQVKFDPASPRLHALPRTVHWKLACYRNSFIHELVCSMVFEGEEKHTDLTALCRAAVSKLDTEDPFNLDQHSAVILQESLEAFTALHTICVMPFSVEHLDVVRSIDISNRHVGASSSSGPLDIVAAAVSKSEWHKSRLHTYLEAAPTILMKSDAMKRHTALAQEISETTEFKPDDVALVKKLQDMHEDLTIVQGKVKMSALDTISASIMRCTTTYVENTMKAATAEPGPWMPWMSSVGALLQAASIAYPFNVSVPSWQSSLAELRQSKFHEGLLINFRGAATALLESEDLFDAVALAKLSAEGKQSASVVLLAEDESLLKEIMTRVAQQVCDAKEGLDKCGCDKALECMNLLSGYFMRGAWPKAWKMLDQAKNLQALASSVQAHGRWQSQELGTMRKLIANLRASHEGAFDKTTIGMKLANLILKKVLAVHDSVKKFDVEILAEAVKASEDEVIASSKALQEVAGGSSTSGVSWKQEGGLDASDDLEKLAKVAEDNGLLTVEVGEIKKRAAVLQTAMDKDGEARSMAGLVDRSAGHAEAMSGLQLAALTICERTLLDSYKAEGDEKRPAIQKAVKDLRSHGLKEKVALHGCLYRWAFKQLTSK